MCMCMYTRNKINGMHSLQIDLRDHIDRRSSGLRGEHAARAAKLQAAAHEPGE